MKRLVKLILNYFPRTILTRLSFIVKPIIRIYLRGNKFTDPIDGSSFRKFLPYGYNNVRENALSPSTFSLLGYDSGLVIYSVLSSGTSSRLDFAKVIQQNRGVPGALNTLVLNQKKEFIRPVVTLTVKEGEIVPFTNETL